MGKRLKKRRSGLRGTLLIRCSKKSLESALRRRRILSSPVVVGSAFVLFLLSASVFLSATIWANYDPWNIPSLVSGLAASVLSYPVIVWLGELLKGARKKKRLWNPRGWLLVQVRRGFASAAFLFGAVVFAGARLLFPVHDTLKELHETIGIGKPNCLVAAQDLYDKKIAKAPRFMVDDGAMFFETVIRALKLDDTNAPSPEWDGIEQRARKAKRDRRAYIRDWSDYITALCLENSGRTKEEQASLETLASSEKTDQIVRCRAYARLGYLAETKNDKATAQKCYLSALQLGATTKLYENLGLLYEDARLFELAEPIFEESDRCFKEENGEADRFTAATHFLNLASFYNNFARAQYAESTEEKDPAKHKVLLESFNDKIATADDLIEKAFREQNDELDIFWVGASIALNENDEKRAVEWLDKAQDLFQRKDAKISEALNRNTFATIGPFYTAWLRVRILFALSPQSPALPTAIRNLAATVNGFSDDPAGRLRAKILQVQETGFFDKDDIADLEKMNAAKLFDSYRIALRPLTVKKN